jgi:hypothetical protein
MNPSFSMTSRSASSLCMTVMFMLLSGADKNLACESPSGGQQAVRIRYGVED